MHSAYYQSSRYWVNKSEVVGNGPLLTQAVLSMTQP